MHLCDLCQTNWQVLQLTRCWAPSRRRWGARWGSLRPSSSHFPPEEPVHSGAESVGTCKGRRGRSTTTNSLGKLFFAPVDFVGVSSVSVSASQKYPNLVSCLPTRAAADADLSADPQTGSRKGCRSSGQRCRQRGTTQTAGPGRAPGPWQGRTSLAKHGIQNTASPVLGLTSSSAARAPHPR